MPSGYASTRTGRDSSRCRRPGCHSPSSGHLSGTASFRARHGAPTAGTHFPSYSRYSPYIRRYAHTTRRLCATTSLCSLWPAATPSPCRGCQRSIQPSDGRRSFRSPLCSPPRRKPQYRGSATSKGSISPPAPPSRRRWEYRACNGPSARRQGSRHSEAQASGRTYLHA